MKLVKMNNGEIRNVTSRNADQLVAAGKAKYYAEFDYKEEKAVIETKEEKAPRKRRTKKA